MGACIAAIQDKTKFNNMNGYGSISLPFSKINKLSIDTSEVIIEGTINSLNYSENNKDKDTGGGILSKIFK